MKSFFITVTGLFCSYVPMSQKTRDLFLWPLASRVLGLSYTKIVLLKKGIVLKVGMEDILNRFIMFLGPYIEYIWEPSTMKLLEQLSKQKQSIVIAGSHIGFTVLESAQSTKGRVFAFEPVQNLYARSKENIMLNPVESQKITLEKMALGNTNSTVTMYVENIRSSIIPYSKNHVPSRTEEVPMISLDTYARNKGISGFDLMLLDIEGYELFALEGAKELLKQKPDLILEVSPRVLSKIHDSSDALFAFLRDRGYTIYIIADNYKAFVTRRNPNIRLISLTSPYANEYVHLDYFNVFATQSSPEIVQTVGHIVD